MVRRQSIKPGGFADMHSRASAEKHQPVMRSKNSLSRMKAREQARENVMHESAIDPLWKGRQLL